MPHMAPFVWGAAPILILVSAYFIYMMMPSPFMFIPPMIPSHKSVTWNWS